jgi:hypothetical protein
VLSGIAAFKQKLIQRIQILHFRHRHKEIRSGILHQSFYLALLVSTTDIPNPISNAIAGYNLGSHPDIKNIPGKSSLILNEQNTIQDIIEKKIVSEIICIGVYAFADIADFMTVYQEILNKGIQGELFLTNVISYMINRKNAIFEALFADAYQDWGTLSEWRNIQKTMRTYFIGVDGVIVKNSGKYGKTNWGNNTILLESNVAVIKEGAVPDN